MKRDKREIVYCDECAYHKDIALGTPGTTCRNPDVRKYFVSRDWFCGYGKKEIKNGNDA